MAFRQLTEQEKAQGWYELGCGCHAHVLRAEIVRQLPKNCSEYCPIADVPGVVPLHLLSQLENERR